jgi:hypothetical protein
MCMMPYLKLLRPYSSFANLCSNRTKRPGITHVVPGNMSARYLNLAPKLWYIHLSACAVLPQAKQAQPNFAIGCSLVPCFSPTNAFLPQAMRLRNPQREAADES